MSSPAAVSSSRAIGVGAAQGVQAVGGDLADDPDGQSRARERLARNDFLGQAELATHRADLVLEQQPQRLDELELQVVGQAADIVVALDVGGARSAAGLDDIGIQRALHQELDVRTAIAHDISDRALERPDELADR